SVRNRPHLGAARSLKAYADTIAIQPAREFVGTGKQRWLQMPLLDRGCDNVHRERQTRKPRVALLDRTLAELIAQPAPRPMQKPQCPLQRRFRAGRDIKDDDAVQDAGNLDRITN